MPHENECEVMPVDEFISLTNEGLIDELEHRNKKAYDEYCEMYQEESE